MPLPDVISALLFDFDGVIVDTEWPIYESWQKLYRSEGHELELKTYVQCIGSDFNTWSPEAYLESLTGKTYDWEKINMLRGKEITSDLEFAVEIPGVVDLLDWADANGIPCAVVSSSSHRWVDGWLIKLSLIERFAAVVCKGDVPQIKPAPDLFLEAAVQLDKKPAECLVIEDSMNGMLAAQKAGMPVAIVPNRITQCLDFSAATLVEESLLTLGEQLR